jgi:DNA recombination protein RmuC
MLAEATVVVGSLAAGATGSWLLMKRRTTQAVALARSEASAQSAVLQERLAGRDRELERLESLANTATSEAESLRSDATALRQKLQKLDTSLIKEREAAQEKLELIKQTQERLSESFSALSHNALKDNNRVFLDLAQSTFEKLRQGAKDDLEKRTQAIGELVKPVSETLTRFDSQVRNMEKQREGAYQSLEQQLKAVAETQQALRNETTNLVRALGTPRVRGRWGEIQLRRVVEMAGMQNHCDFEEQASVTTEDGRLRPDMIVRLPGGKNIVIDAKAPLEGYLRAMEAEDEGVRLKALDDHARHVHDHLQALGRKSYWSQFQPTPELVVLFLPGESFFSAALERDPTLIERGVEHQVILATPTTLIALLKAVAYGWQQEALAENARLISDLGKELYGRLGTMTTHMRNLGKQLSQAVQSYNKTVGSLETRVLVCGRRFRDLQATGAAPEIEPLNTLDQPLREMQATELQPALPADATTSNGEEHDNETT